MQPDNQLPRPPVPPMPQPPMPPVPPVPAANRPSTPPVPSQPAAAPLSPPPAPRMAPPPPPAAPHPVSPSPAAPHLSTPPTPPQVNRIPSAPPAPSMTPAGVPSVSRTNNPPRPSVTPPPAPVTSTAMPTGAPRVSPPASPPPPATSAVPPAPTTPPSNHPLPAVPATAAQSSASAPKRGGGPLLKILATFIVILLLGAGGYAGYQLLMSRTGSGGTPNGMVELTYWGLWEPESVMQPFIDEYQAANPNIKITYKNNSKTEYSARLRNALASESGPDMFRMHNTWTYMLQNHLATLPANVYAPAQYQQDFYPIAYQNLRLNDQLVAIPLMVDGLALYYNTDLFNKAGIQPPTTWDSFQEAAQRLTVVDQNRVMQIGGAAMGYVENVEHWPDVVGVLMYQNRADPTYPSDQVAYDAIAFYSLFAYRYNTWSLDMPPATEAFATGKLAMMFGPSWEVFNIQQLSKDKGTPVDFRVIPIPQLPETNVTWANYWVEGVNNKSAHQEEAWKFLKFLSEKDTMQRMFEAQSKVREFGEIPSRPDVADQYKDHPYMGAYIVQMPAARTHAFASGTSDDNGINGRIVKYYEDSLKETAKGQAPSTVLETTAQGIKEVFRDYGLNL